MIGFPRPAKSSCRRTAGPASMVQTPLGLLPAKHWASEGRGGTADNALSKLVRDRKIKRIPLVGERGSHYAV